MYLYVYFFVLVSCTGSAEEIHFSKLLSPTTASSLLNALDSPLLTGLADDKVCCSVCCSVLQSIAGCCRLLQCALQY